MQRPESQKRGGRHDHPVRTETALGGLLSNERSLQRVWFLRRPQPFECRDLMADDSADGRDTGPDRLVAEES